MRTSRTPARPPRRVPRWWGGLLALAIALGGLSCQVGATAAATAPSGGQWTTYGGSMRRDSIQPSSPSLAALRVRWHSPTLSGAVYGEPLIDNRMIYVATEADTVYALSANTGKVIWSRQLGAAVPASELPCGDISPTVGVTSTMVIDPARHELFVAAAVEVHGDYEHQVLALSTATGKVRWRRDVDLSWWDRPAQLQRTGLALADGRVIVAYGGNFGDCSSYRGTVLGVPETGKGPVASYVVPTAREGAVWAPSGVSVNAQGDIFFATGNGASRAASDFDEGDSVIELSPGFHRLGVFAPANWLQDNETDGDLGSAAPMLLPGNRALEVGKETTGYLLSTTHLGGIGGQLAATSVCFSQGGDAWQAPLAYVACPGGSLTALKVGARSLSVAWRGPPGTSGSPTIAGGLVFEVSDGTLSGLSLTTGRRVVTMPVIPTEHFAAPSAGEGLLVVAGADSVEAFEGPAGWRP